MHSFPASVLPATREQTDVGRDIYVEVYLAVYVVEEIGRQGDNSLQPFVLRDPTPGPVRVAACIAGEERRAVYGNGDVWTAARTVPGLAIVDDVLEEKELPIGETRGCFGRGRFRPSQPSCPASRSAHRES